MAAGKNSRKELHMPDLMVDFITSLDGYAAAEGWPGLWASKDRRTSSGWLGRLTMSTRS
jgi:hypothetical protein